MSKCICISCGYESFILCCTDRSMYSTLCLPCLKSISYEGLNCQECSRPISNVVYRLQKQTPVDKNNHHSHFINSSYNKEANQKEYQRLNSDPPNHFMRFNAPSTPLKRQFGGQLNKGEAQIFNIGKKHLVQDLKIATECLQKPLDNKLWLQRQRKKNNIVIENLESSGRWDDGSSQVSDESGWRYS